MWCDGPCGRGQRPDPGALRRPFAGTGRRRGAGRLAALRHVVLGPLGTRSVAVHARPACRLEPAGTPQAAALRQRLAGTAPTLALRFAPTGSAFVLPVGTDAHVLAVSLAPLPRLATRGARCEPRGAKTSRPGPEDRADRLGRRPATPRRRLLPLDAGRRPTAALGVGL